MGVQKLLKAGNKLVLGKKEVLKNLKQDLLSEVFAAQNCPDGLFNELQNFAKLSGATARKLDINAEELASQLKKGFNITVAGIKK